MSGAPIIRAYDFYAAETETLLTLHRFFQESDREFWPDRDPIAFNEAAWRNKSPFNDRRDWQVLVGGELVAHGHLGFGLTGDNPHAGGAGFIVRPDWRRRGLGTRLLNEIIAEMHRLGRTLLILGTGSQVAAGEAFAAQTGAEMALEARLNRLDLATLDRAVLERMKATGLAKAGAFTLGWWEDTLPEDELDDIAEMFQTMNSAPRDKLKTNDHKTTADQLRQGLKNIRIGKLAYWCLYARETATGRLAGFSETYWHPDRPRHLGQGNTGVMPAYRGHALGRLIKATMLERVLKERPTVQFIDTSNADSNAPMLKINQELGFRLHSVGKTWQLPLQSS